MPSDLITLEYDGPVAIMSNNRPDKHNAANDDMDARLWECLAELHQKPDIRAIVWRGVGKSFSSGRDTTQIGVRTKDISNLDFIEQGLQIVPLIENRKLNGDLRPLRDFRSFGALVADLSKEKGHHISVNSVEKKRKSHQEVHHQECYDPDGKRLVFDHVLSCCGGNGPDYGVTTSLFVTILCGVVKR